MSTNGFHNTYSKINPFKPFNLTASTPTRNTKTHSQPSLIRTCILGLMLLLGAKIGQAQNININGQVTDSTNKGIPGATLLVFAADTTLLGAAASQANGTFEITVETNQNPYQLVVSHIAYQTQTINLNGKTTFNIKLSERSEQIEEVVVTGKKSIVEFVEGNMVVNLKELKGYATDDAAKVLSRVPGIKVNEYDGIKLHGQNATLYVDGREQKMPDQALVVKLMSMRATEIDKVELIEVATGKETAASGRNIIINLKTTKHSSDGYTIFMQGHLWSKFKNESPLSGSLTAYSLMKKGNVQIDAYAYYGKGTGIKNYRDSTIYIENDDTTYHTSNYKDATPNDNYTAAANLEWDVHNGHLISLTGSINQIYDKKHKFDEHIRIGKRQADTTYTITNEQQGYSIYAMGGLGYASPQNKPTQFKAQYSLVNMGKNQDYRYFIKSPENQTNPDFLSTKPDMSALTHTIRADFTQRLDSIKLTIEAGSRADITSINDEVIYYKGTGTTPPLKTYKPPTSSTYHGSENIFASYLRLAYQPIKLIGLNAALRVEHTRYNVDLDSNTQNPKIKPYTNFFPYVHLYFNFARNYQTKIAFETSIIRPDYTYMLPGLRQLSTETYKRGTADIKPTLMSKIEWTNYIFEYITLWIAYHHYTNFTHQLTIRRDEQKSELVINNVADQKTLYAAMYLPFQFGHNGQLSGDITAFATHNWLVNPKNGYEISGKNTYWNSWIKSSIYYEITPKLKIDAHLFYQFRANLPMIDNQRRWYVDTGIEYSMLKDNRLSISLRFDDIFRSYKESAMHKFGANKTFIEKRYPPDILTFAISYRLEGGEKVTNPGEQVEMNMQRFN